MLYTKLKRGFLHKLDLSDQEKLLWVYILTNQHNNAAGIYYLPLGYVAEDMGWKMKPLKKGFNKLLNEGLVKYDYDNKIMLIPKWLKYHPIQNPNQEVQVRNCLDEVKESPLILAFQEYANRHLDKELPKIDKWFDKQNKDPSRNPLDNPLPNNDNDNDTDNDTDKEKEKEIIASSKFTEFDYHLSKDFLAYQKKQFPKLVNNEKKDIKNGADTIRLLREQDGFSEEEITETLRFAVKDDFWRDKVLSIANIRAKSKNGNTKFQNIYRKFKNKPKTRTEQVMDIDLSKGDTIWNT